MCGSSSNTSNQIILVKRYVNFSLKKSVLRPAVATIIMAFVLISVSRFLPNTMLTVIGLGVLGVSVYSGAMYILVGPSVIDDVKKAARNMYSAKL